MFPGLHYFWQTVILNSLVCNVSFFLFFLLLLAACKIFSLSLVFSSLILMCLSVIYLYFFLLGVCWAFWIDHTARKWQGYSSNPSLTPKTMFYSLFYTALSHKFSNFRDMTDVFWVITTAQLKTHILLTFWHVTFYPTVYSIMV